MYSSSANDENNHINMIMITTGSKRESQLQGPRPPPLKLVLPKDSIYSTGNKVISKKPYTSISHDSRHQFTGRCRRKSNLGNQPIVIYLRSPKIIHTRPQDFMVLVQQLTGNHQESSEARVKEDHRCKSYPCNKDLDNDQGMIINNKDIIKEDDQFLELQLNSYSASSDQQGVSISSLKGSNIFSPMFAANTSRFLSSSPDTRTNSSNWQGFGGSIF